MCRSVSATALTPLAPLRAALAEALAAPGFTLLACTIEAEAYLGRL